MKEVLASGRRITVKQKPGYISVLRAGKRQPRRHCRIGGSGSARANRHPRKREVMFVNTKAGQEACPTLLQFHIAFACQEFEVADEIEFHRSPFEARQANHIGKIALAIAPVERNDGRAVPGAGRIALTLIGRELVERMVPIPFGCTTILALRPFADRAGGVQHRVARTRGLVIAEAFQLAVNGCSDSRSASSPAFRNQPQHERIDSVSRSTA